MVKSKHFNHHQRAKKNFQYDLIELGNGRFDLIEEIHQI